MTDDLLARTRTALEGMPKGPWRFDAGQDDLLTDGDGLVVPPSVPVTQFITSAREHLPELVAEVERLRAGREVERGMLRNAATEIQGLRAEVERLRGAFDGLAASWQTELADDDSNGYGAALERCHNELRDVLRGD